MGGRLLVRRAGEGEFVFFIPPIEHSTDFTHPRGLLFISTLTSFQRYLRASTSIGTTDGPSLCSVCPSSIL